LASGWLIRTTRRLRHPQRGLDHGRSLH
jgi:hypothetical protein